MDIAGVAYESQSSTYRHFITDMNQTIRVTLKRLSGKGFPKLMVKLANKRPTVWSGSPYSYDERSDTTGEGYSA